MAESKDLEGSRSKGLREETKSWMNAFEKATGKSLGEGARRRGRRRQSVILAIDISGSMSKEKLTQARVGTLSFYENAVSKGYDVGLIAFESDSRVLFDVGQIRSKEQLRLEMDALASKGSTNMTSAISLVHERLRSVTGIRAMVLATDGEPDKPSEAIRAADRAKEDGISIICIGTHDADHSFLQRIVSADDLAVMVDDSRLGAGMADAAEMLPGAPAEPNAP